MGASVSKQTTTLNGVLRMAHTERAPALITEKLPQNLVEYRSDPTPVQEIEAAYHAPRASKYLYNKVKLEYKTGTSIQHVIKTLVAERTTAIEELEGK